MRYSVLKRRVESALNSMVDDAPFEMIVIKDGIMPQLAEHHGFRFIMWLPEDDVSAEQTGSNKNP
jgi:hypothetical protein